MAVGGGDGSDCSGDDQGGEGGGMRGGGGARDAGQLCQLHPPLQAGVQRPGVETATSCGVAGFCLSSSQIDDDYFNGKAQ